MQETVAILGEVEGTVEVQIGPQLLEVFSKQLYSSPNKAFEELVSNSWDAGANTVYIGLPDPAAQSIGGNSLQKSIWVLDDGSSMDFKGLEQLWTIAFSLKRQQPKAKRRNPIGKFGVGKLATYLLANNIVYFCKAEDGIIRSVEVDYTSLTSDSPNQLTSIRPTKLNVRKLSMQNLRTILDGYEDGDRIFDLVNSGVPRPKQPVVEDEYGGESLPDPAPSTTWTIVLLSSLKTPGKSLQLGRIRWMLRASLPLSPVMTITLNNELLLSSKIDEEVEQTWEIGPSLGVTEIIVPGEDGEDDVAYDVTSSQDKYPYVTLGGIAGQVTGRVTLYKNKISGGKSELEGASHGYFVNILGRVINLKDNSFGLPNLSHGAWAKFRATVRADWLDAHLSVSREGLQDTPEVQAFRAFLLSLFNTVRSTYGDSRKAALPNAGDILTKRYGSLPLKPLWEAVLDGLTGLSGAAPYIHVPPGQDRAALACNWKELIKDNPGQIVGDIVLDNLGQDSPLVIYDVGQLKILVNEEHPFSREHSGSIEQKELLRDTAFADIMVYSYMSEIGLSDDSVAQVIAYKEDLLRLLAKVRRKTAGQLAELLVNAASHAKGLERALDEAFDHLGFVVKPLAGSGEPEGVAVAPLTPGSGHALRAYKFTYDAKSTIHAKAKSGNLNVAGLARHRNKYAADHAIVVAVDFQDGVYAEECAANSVTPMRAKDLALLLVSHATKGPVDFVTFEKLFALTDADSVGEWVQTYVDGLANESIFTLDQFLEALSNCDFSGPDSLAPEIVAREGRKLTGNNDIPSAKDISNLVRGLQTLIPWLIRLEQDGHIILSGTPKALRKAIMEQLQNLPSEFQVVLGSE